MARTFKGSAGAAYAKVVTGPGGHQPREYLLSCNDSTVGNAVQFLVVSSGAAAPTGNGHVLSSPFTNAGTGGSGASHVVIHSTGDIYVKRAAASDSEYCITELP
jgi:hypothetical protein